MKVRKRPFPHDTFLSSIRKLSSNVLNLSHVNREALAFAQSRQAHL